MKKKVIYINGLPGSGKLTIANMLAEKFDARVIDNHKVNNLIFDLIDTSGEIPDFVFSSIGKMNAELRELLGKLPQDNDYIFTEYMENYKKSKSYSNFVKLADDLDAELYTITLLCDYNKVLNRIDSAEREQRKKLTCKDLYQKVIYEGDLIPIEGNNSFVIDNTDLTEQETFDQILQWFKSK